MCRPVSSDDISPDRSLELDPVTTNTLPEGRSSCVRSHLCQPSTPCTSSNEETGDRPQLSRQVGQGLPDIYRDFASSTCDSIISQGREEAHSQFHFIRRIYLPILIICFY
jgi:hypothetical protein